MRCPHCEADTPDGAKFCIACGTPLTPRCAQCGADTLPRAKFCAECGTPLTAQNLAPPAAPPPSPLRYTPGYLAEKILTSKAALEGERKQVTVLFADLKGSMEFLADRDPEEARQLLDPVLERMMAAVHRYEGTVNQVMGDGIMALFGAPIAHEDHAVRACYAALAMQAAVKQYAIEVQRIKGVPLQMRVGMNAGEVVVRTQGDYRRAIDCFRQTMASLGGAQHRERFSQPLLPAVSSRAFPAACPAELGTFDEGRAIGDEGLRMAEAAAHPASIMMASWGCGLLALRQGDLPRALPWLERAVHICQDADLPAYFPRMAAALGVAYTMAGRVADAVPLLTQGIEQTTATERVSEQALCHLSLGEAQTLAGRLEEAYALAERALALARERQERGHEAYGLRLLGEIAARREPPHIEEAKTRFRQALALAEELGMQPLVAHCHLDLGFLSVKIGRWEDARAELPAAIEVYRVMDMIFWMPKAEATLAQVEGR